MGEIMRDMPAPFDRCQVIFNGILIADYTKREGPPHGKTLYIRLSGIKPPTKRECWEHAKYMLAKAAAG